LLAARPFFHRVLRGCRRRNKFDSSDDLEALLRHAKGYAEHMMVTAVSLSGQISRTSEADRSSTCVLLAKGILKK
jgi:hypothetical protein